MPIVLHSAQKCILLGKDLAVSLKPDASLREMIPQSDVYWLSSEWGKAREAFSIIMSHGLMYYFMELGGLCQHSCENDFETALDTSAKAGQRVGSVFALCLAVVLFHLVPFTFSPTAFTLFSFNFCFSFLVQSNPIMGPSYSFCVLCVFGFRAAGKQNGETIKCYTMLLSAAICSPLLGHVVHSQSGTIKHAVNKDDTEPSWLWRFIRLALIEVSIFEY